MQEFFACCPSDTPFGLSLGPDLPWADEPSPGNLRLSMAWILTMLSLLIPAFSLLPRPALLSVCLRPTIECSSTAGKWDMRNELCDFFYFHFSISLNIFFPIISFSLLNCWYSSSFKYPNSLLISNNASTSLLDPKLIFRNLLKSSLLFLPYP